MRVLIVEDNQELRDLLCASLKEVDIEAHGAASVDKVADRIEEGNFDIIVIDSVLGEGDGIGLIKTVRAGSKGANTPIVLTSVIATNLARRMAMNAGCTEFLVKPFGTGTFINLLRRLA